MCDKTNSEEIVAEMLAYLETADYSIREEMVSDDCFCCFSKAFTGVESCNIG